MTIWAPTTTVDHGAQHALSAEARWLLDITAYLGQDLTTWPLATLDLAVGLTPGAWTEAGLQHPLALPVALLNGGRGGEAPTPYPEQGHLLSPRVPDGTQNFTPEAPTPRDGKARGAAVERALTTAGVPLTREQLRPWDLRQRRWLTGVALRALVETVSGDPIRDAQGYELECQEGASVYQHREIVDAFRLQIHTCKKRGRCPHCGATYGEERGAELLSLIEAALDRRHSPVKDHTAIAWGIVVTLPRAVSDMIGDLADQGIEGRKAFRKELGRVREVAQRFLVRLFNLHRDDPKELAAVVNIHPFSSKTPTRGYHWHAHLLVPNVRKDGRELRRRAVFDPEDLQAARAHLEAELATAWPDLVDHGKQANFHLKWFTGSAEGRRGLRHRCRYDGRHPFADVIKLAQGERGPSQLYADQAVGQAATLFARIREIQHTKLQRYLGWLVPGRRKPVGLHRVEDDSESDWIAVENGYRRVIAVTDQGVIVTRHDLGSEIHTEVIAESIKHESQGPPKRWEARKDDPACSATKT